MLERFPFLHTFRLRAPLGVLFVFVLSLLLAAPGVEARQSKQNVYAGYRTLSSSLPAQRLMIHMGVWYPTRRKAGNVKVGDWTFRAARNAPIMQGPWPVIILSHDVTGSAWTHHDIAAALAARGFIVAAPTHDHDNGEDMALLFSDRELPVRALQLRAALDLVLEHAQIGKEADRSRIGFLGFGMPASAGLLLAGGELTEADLMARLYMADRLHLQRHGSPITTETWCRGSAMPVIGKDFQGLIAEYGSVVTSEIRDGVWYVRLTDNYDYAEYLSYVELETFITVRWTEDRGMFEDPDGVKGKALDIVPLLPEVANADENSYIPWLSIAEAVSPLVVTESYTKEEFISDLAMSAISANSWMRPIGSEKPLKP